MRTRHVYHHMPILGLIFFPIHTECIKYSTFVYTLHNKRFISSELVEYIGKKASNIKISR